VLGAHRSLCIRHACGEVCGPCTAPLSHQCPPPPPTSPALPRSASASECAESQRGDHLLDVFSDDASAVSAVYDDNGTVLVTAAREGDAIIKLWMPISSLGFAALGTARCVRTRGRP
jgi:hypothetical protein